jgi:hypothetical protein
MRRVLALSVVAAALATSGCLYSRVDEEWGQAFEEAQEVQTANPSGSGSPEGPMGIDPVTGEAVAERYYKGQETQPTRSGPAMILEQIR